MKIHGGVAPVETRERGASRDTMGVVPIETQGAWLQWRHGSVAQVETLSAWCQLNHRGRGPSGVASVETRERGASGDTMSVVLSK